METDVIDVLAAKSVGELARVLAQTLVPERQLEQLQIGRQGAVGIVVRFSSDREGQRVKTADRMLASPYLIGAAMTAEAAAMPRARTQASILSVSRMVYKLRRLGEHRVKKGKEQRPRPQVGPHRPHKDTFSSDRKCQHRHRR